MICRSTDIKAALRSRQRGFLLNPHRFASAGDPYYAQRVLGLHMDGTNTSTTFTDNSPNPKTATAVGTAQISTAQSKFGGASGVFNSGGNYLSFADSTAWDLGIASAPFTISAWVYLSTLSTTQAIFGRGGGTAAWNSTTGHQYAFFVNNDNKLYLQWWTGSTIGALSATHSIAAATWAHMEVGYDGTTTHLFVNGVKLTSTAGGYAKPSSSNITRVAQLASTDARTGDGYLDDLLVYNGACLHTANFTPSGSAFSN